MPSTAGPFHISESVSRQINEKKHGLMPMVMDKTNLRITEVRAEGSIGDLNGTGGIPLSGISEGDDEGVGFFDKRTGKKRSLTDDSSKKREMAKGFAGSQFSNTSTKDTRQKPVSVDDELDE
jgi:hypothetical protein